MKKTLLLATIFLTAGVLVSARPADKPSAEAELLDANGDSVATATLAPASQGVKITLDVQNLAPGMHAFHIHSVGSCEPPDFKSAGGHFNPDGKKHGLKNPEGPHAGDMENFEVGADGTAHVELVNTSVTLGEGKNSLFQPGGTALVIHEKADDLVSDPAGNAGARVACGVIEKSENDD
jgi:superoxide dismutase, Cu-Zn family